MFLYSMSAFPNVWFLFFFLIFVYLSALDLLHFIYFWLCWVFIAEPELSLVAASQGYSLVVVCGFLTVVASLGAEHKL